MRVTDVSKLSPAAQEQIRRQLAEQLRQASELKLGALRPASVVKAVAKQPTPGRMNKTEEAYARILEMRLRRGEVVWYAFEPIRFRLADLSTYTPDFLVQLADGTLELHEVKARTKAGKVLITDDSAVKLRQIRETYPMFGLKICAGYRGDFEITAR